MELEDRTEEDRNKVAVLIKREKLRKGFKLRADAVADWRQASRYFGKRVRVSQDSNSFCLATTKWEMYTLELCMP